MFRLIPAEHWDYSSADLVRGLRVALSSERRRFEAQIEIPGVRSALPVRSARAALVLALKALALPSGSSVGVPLYCCPVVFSAVQTAGYRVCFIDVEAGTCCMSPVDLAAKRTGLGAVIAVHMFGHLCDMRAIREAAAGIPIIEDCAQALGSHFKGRAAGCFGDIAVFSFRSGKYVSAGEGGAMRCSRTDLEQRIAALINELPAPGRGDECMHVMKTWMRSLLRRQPLWGMVGERLWSAYAVRVSFASQSPIVLTQGYRTDHATAMRRLSRLSLFVAKQRANADNYLRNLDLDKDMLCRESPGAFFNRMQFPVLLSNSMEREQLAGSLRREHISVSQPYKNVAAIASECYGYRGDCPQAERVADTVLVIPCNYMLRQSKVQHITNSVNRAWKAITGTERTVQSPLARAANASTCDVSPTHHGQLS
jgi:perosamine synthetase